MDIFEIDPNALIILVIMIIGGLKWLVERLRGPQLGDDDEEWQQPTAFEDLYEEARREILERQGRSGQAPQVEEAPRPAIFQPLQEAPPRPAAAPQESVPPPLPAQARAPQPFKKPSAPRKLTAAERAAAERFQRSSQSSLRKRGRRGGIQGSVRDLLATPGSARKAIVLREILGPPKGAA